MPFALNLMSRHVRQCLVCLAGLLWLTLPSPAQRMLDLTDPRTRQSRADVDKRFAEPPAPDTLACSVDSIEPRLNFAFRWQAGFRARLPVRQFPPEATRLRVILRIQPEAGEPSYLWQNFTVPAGARPRGAYGQSDGGFFLGEGTYEVDWLLLDELGRSCRDHWQVKLKLNQKDRKVAQFLEPGVVAPIVLTWSGTTETRERPYRLAFVVHASPIFPRSTRLTAFDLSFLTTMLTTVLEDTPFREAWVYAVSLEQQEIIFESEELDPLSFNELLDAMSGLNLGLIGIDQYSNPKGEVDVLANIVNRELASENPPDGIVFIGPNSRHLLKFPRERLESVPGMAPLFFYLHLDYYSRRFPWADTIEKLTKGQGGKVFDIRHPRDLIQALEKMEQLLARRRGAATRATATDRNR